MASLVYSDADGHVTELHLGPGANFLGRDENNSVVIPDGSISNRHCELICENGQVLVRDLGSDTGTCVNGDLVDEGWLRSGDTLRVGNFEFRLKTESPGPALADDPPVSAVDIDGAQTCSPALLSQTPVLGSVVPLRTGCLNHPTAEAQWKCPQCGENYCDTCILDGHALRVRGAHFCPNCRCLAIPVPSPGSVPTGPQSFTQEMVAAWIYPFKGDGIYILLAGVIFLAVAGFVRSMVPLLAFFVMVLTTGYLMAYSQKVVTASAMGEPEPPTWPDFSDFLQDIFIPFFQAVGLLALYLLPFLICQIRLDQGEAGNAVVTFGFLALGLFMMPMAWLGISMHSSIAALSPHFVIPSILRVPGHYLVLTVELAVLVSVQVGLQSLLERLAIPILGGVLNSFLSVYFLMVFCRLLGVLYQRNQKRLGWH